VTGLDDPDAAARWVLDRPGTRTEWAIVKLGSRGALLRSRSQGCAYTSPGVPVEVQDTVGCGDSFAAAVVLGFTRRFSVPATLALANAVGAATATGRGAGTNVARAEKVMELLRWGAREHGDAGARDASVEAAGNLEASLLPLSAARAA
jgi:sugar/nucleoside kinase (ribokinase family)